MLSEQDIYSLGFQKYPAKRKLLHIPYETKIIKSRQGGKVALQIQAGWIMELFLGQGPHHITCLGAHHIASNVFILIS